MIEPERAYRVDERMPVGSGRRGRHRLRAHRRRRALRSASTPRGTPEEALAFFTGGYDALAFEVELLEQRIRAGVMSPDEAHRVGQARSAAQVAERQRRRRPRRRCGAGSTRSARSIGAAARGAPAERAAARRRGQGRQGADRRRGREARARATTGATAPTGCAQLLDEWKALPRLDRAADDALWRRFSTARTTYTRRRKAHFAELNEKREARPRRQGAAGQGGRGAGRLDRVGPDRGPLPRPDAAVEGRRPGAQATSTTSCGSGSARAQDTFFGARDAANAELDAEFAANAEVKEALLVEAEALVPVTDLDGRQGAVPRHRRALGRRRQGPPRPDEGPRGPDAQGRAGDPRRSRTTSGAAADPEKSARADDMVAKLERAIADSRPTSRRPAPPGNEKKVKELEENLASRQSFLEMARRASGTH